MVDGRCTNSARLSTMASATHSAVAFSPLKKDSWERDITQEMQFLDAD